LHQDQNNENSAEDAADEKPISYDQLNRREIRALIFHLLYTAEARDYQESVEQVIENYRHGFDIDIPLDSEAATTTQAIIAERDQLDAIYSPLLTNWRFDRISTSTKLILRFAIWELLHKTIDPRIIMNEAVELSKCFAEKDSYRFINGILDRIVQNKQSASE